MFIKMKFSIRNITFLFCLFFTISTNSLFAQNGLKIYLDPKYGPDSLSRLECAANLSTMSEFMKLDLFDYALPSWRKVFAECPGSSRNIYLYGVRIYRAIIEREKNPELRQSLVDTLMLIYDRRIENFGQEGLVLGRKGTDLLKYRPDAIPEVHSYLEKSVRLSGKNAEEAVLVTFMQTSVFLFRDGKIQGQEVIGNYLVIADILSQRIATGEKDQAGTALKNVESVFSESGAGSCTDLINIFTPMYDQNSSDIELLKKITILFEKRGCENSELFANASENLYAREPSARAAYNIARLFVKREEFAKAGDYYKKAIELAEDPEEKSTYLYQLAQLEFKKLDQYASSRAHALEAARLKPGWGDPYILVGNLYATSSIICNENELQQSSVFWVAVDQFIRAKSVDTTKTKEANELIGLYKQYFPNAEDAFFYGFQEGQEYTVGCWINEKTRVRTRSN
jgi:tetratricopeptide (TPR) repeat protein